MEYLFLIQSFELWEIPLGSESMLIIIFTQIENKLRGHSREGKLNAYDSVPLLNFCVFVQV